MTYWATVVLVLALAGSILNLLFGTPIKLVLHDILLFLIALGMLVRIKYKTAEAEKEKLRKKLEEAGVN